MEAARKKLKDLRSSSHVTVKQEVVEQNIPHTEESGGESVFDHAPIADRTPSKQVASEGSSSPSTSPESSSHHLEKTPSEHNGSNELCPRSKDCFLLCFAYTYAYSWNCNC